MMEIEKKKYESLMYAQSVVRIEINTASTIKEIRAKREVIKQEDLDIY